jgi:Resolvase, N terminal domain
VNRITIYVRVGTADQHVESKLLDLREFAAKRGFEVVKEYEDKGISGCKARRPGLDALMADARRKRFDVVLVAAFDRVARNVRHFLETLDELNHLGIEFVSLRENIDTGGHSPGASLPSRHKSLRMPHDTGKCLALTRFRVPFLRNLASGTNSSDPCWCHLRRPRTQGNNVRPRLPTCR